MGIGRSNTSCSGVGEARGTDMTVRGGVDCRGGQVIRDMTGCRKGDGLRVRASAFANTLLANKRR